MHNNKKHNNKKQKKPRLYRCR